jgi:putative ABC transport system ATP-binding protein
MTPTNRPAGATVSATGVEVCYDTPAGTVTALVHPGLRIEAGTSVAVMGPSGCGKSTLLGLLAGLAVPTSGQIRVGDTALSELGERSRVRFRRQRLGMIYQADNLLPHLTVEENIALAPAIAGRDGDDPATLIDQLGLGGLGGRFPDQLSGGQRQRVAVARAVVSRPPLILADEPTGALDEANAASVIGLLLDAQRRIGATLILVTHEPAIAAQLDRIEHLDRPARPRETADVS